jgi:FkbM family methyltransferase
MVGNTRRLAEGLRWRWWFLRRYWFLLRTFRNGLTLTMAYRQQQSCGRAVLRDGTCLLHPPGRAGFVQTILEIWHEQNYAPGWFYRPANTDVIIDAGANVGLFSIWIARQAPQCRVVALEPFEENFSYLQKNLSAARVQRATAYQTALGERSGWGQMVAQGPRSLDHQLVLDGDARLGEKRVRVISLPDLIEQVGAQRIAFLKVDIEGAESVVFSNVKSSTMSRIDHVAIEYHEHLCTGIAKLLVEKLEPTHCVRLHPEPDGKCGILLGKRRAR